jgi:thiol-disulfide isomerase/thioredoxin
MKQLSLPAALLIAVAGVAAGFVGYRLINHQAPVALVATPSSAPQAQAAAAPEAPEASAPVPEAVPEIRMPDLLGHPRAISEFAGQPRIINFWATWCGPCRREIPLLNSLQHSHRQEKLQIIGIAVDFDKAVQEYVKKTRIDYPVFIGEDAGLEAAQKFGISDLVLPFSVFADAQNRVVAVKIGELHSPEAEFILKTIRQLDAGQHTLPEARAAIEAELKNEAQHRAQSGDSAT